MVWIQSTETLYAQVILHYNFPTQYSVGETGVTVHLVVVKLVTVRVP